MHPQDSEVNSGSEIGAENSLIVAYLLRLVWSAKAAANNRVSRSFGIANMRRVARATHVNHQNRQLAPKISPGMKHRIMT